MLSEIEIAQAASMKPIGEIAAALGIDARHVENYGHYKAKISLDAWKDLDAKPDGKLILVLSAQDPGFGNWLDTAGHNEGTVLLRWAGATDNPLPEAKVVKLADIRK